MRHRGQRTMARRVQRPAATASRHRAQPAHAYPWLRAAGTVGLATLVPVTGGWIAVSAIGFDGFDFGAPSTTHNRADSGLPAGTRDGALPTASSAVVLSRSPSPSLEAAARMGQRMPVGSHVGQMPDRVGVDVGSTSPTDATEGTSAKHRAAQMPSDSPTPSASGRHRADDPQEPSTNDGEHPGHTDGGGGAQGDRPGAGHANQGADDGGQHGGGAPAYGHDRGGPSSRGYGEDRADNGQERSQSGSQSGSHADGQDNAGGASQEGSGEQGPAASDNGTAHGQSAAGGHGQGQGR